MQDGFFIWHKMRSELAFHLYELNDYTAHYRSFLLSFLWVSMSLGAEARARKDLPLRAAVLAEADRVLNLCQRFLRLRWARPR